MQQVTAPSWVQWGFIWLGCLLLVCGYVGWPTANFTEAEDSIVMALNILEGRPELHPNHLLFEPLYHGLLTLAGHVMPEAAPLAVIQSVTVFFAGLALAAVFRLVHRHKGSINAAIAVGMVATSFCFWHYSKVVDAYVPALALGLVTLVFYDARRSAWTPGAAAGLALLAAAATLLHQLYVFLALLLFAALALEKGPARWRVCLTFAVVGGLIVLFAYGLAYIQTEGRVMTLRNFADWAMGYARDGLWDPPGPATPILGTIGFLSALATPVPVMAVPTLSDMLTSNGLGGGRSLLEEAFIANGVPVWIALLALLAAVCALGIYLVFLLRALFQPSSLVWARIERVLAFSIGLYAVLVILWEAANREFWLLVVVLLITFVVLRLRWTLQFQIAAITAIFLIGSVNFLLGIRPLSDRSKDYWVASLDSVVARTTAEDIILIDCTWLCQQYMRIMPERRFVVASQPGAALPVGEGRRVLISWVMEPPWPESAARAVQRRRFMQELVERYGDLPRDDLVQSGLPVVWALSAEGQWDALETDGE